MNALSSEREVAMGKWRRHSREFKEQAVERMKGCENIHELARELDVERKLLYTWKYQLEGRPEKNHANYSGRPPAETSEERLRRENKELKAALGQKAAELDFFAAALRRVKRERPTSEAQGGTASTPKSGPEPGRQGS
jgi:transposase-like protein